LRSAPLRSASLRLGPLAPLRLFFIGATAARATTAWTVWHVPVDRRGVVEKTCQAFRVARHPAQSHARYFKGASADDAINRAIVEREISDPLTQSRLAAQKMREIAT
jgi:hypothetical protein